MAQALRVHEGDERRVSRPAASLQRTRTMPVLSAFDEIDRLFDELLPRSMFRLGLGPVARGLMEAQAPMPRIDLIERDNELVLRAEVPGIRKEDLEVSVDENSVTLRGNVVHESDEQQGDYYRCEIARGEFVRTVALPSVVDTEKARATLRDGVLELVMPKLEAAKRRKIQIA